MFGLGLRGHHPGIFEEDEHMDPFSGFLGAFGVNEDRFANNFAQSFRSSRQPPQGMGAFFGLGGDGGGGGFEDLIRYVQEASFQAA